MLEISTSPEILPGSSLKTKITLKLEEPSQMWYGGLEFLADPRPCGTRSFLIVKHDIFCAGEFEPGIYIRERSVKISPRQIPTFPQRKSVYRAKAEVTIKKGEFDASFVAEAPVVIKIPSTPIQKTEERPVTISLRGLRISLEKDQFKPGDEIPIEFDANFEELQTLTFSLVKNAQILCDCHYSKVCSFIRPLPPEVLDTTKAHGGKGIAKLNIPSNAECTHNYHWASAKKGYSVQSFGDVVHWFVQVSGKKSSGEEVQFNLDFDVIAADKPEEISLVVPSKDQEESEILIKRHNFDVKSATRVEDGCVFRLGNYGDIVEGVTIRIAGIKDELFESSPLMFGVAKWRTEDPVELFYPLTQLTKDIREFQFLIESNNQPSARLRHVFNE